MGRFDIKLYFCLLALFSGFLYDIWG